MIYILWLNFHPSVLIKAWEQSAVSAPPPSAYSFITSAVLLLSFPRPRACTSVEHTSFLVCIPFFLFLSSLWTWRTLAAAPSCAPTPRRAARAPLTSSGGRGSQVCRAANFTQISFFHANGGRLLPVEPGHILRRLLSPPYSCFSLFHFHFLLFAAFKVKSSCWLFFHSWILEWTWVIFQNLESF